MIFDFSPNYIPTKEDRTKYLFEPDLKLTPEHQNRVIQMRKYFENILHNEDDHFYEEKDLPESARRLGIEAMISFGGPMPEEEKELMFREGGVIDITHRQIRKLLSEENKNAR